MSVATVQDTLWEKPEILPIKIRKASQGKESSVFSDIYQEEINIVVWQRELPETLQNAVKTLLNSRSNFKASMRVTPQNVFSSLREVLGDSDQKDLVEDVAGLVDVFCRLFALKQVGLRLVTLDQAMCPKFHVDKVPCRLITTYQGVATEWLPHHLIDRSKLGAGSGGLPDDQSDLFKNSSDIQQLRCGDVALLKGESWKGNENAGLVHRSPMPAHGENRLLLRLDYLG